MLFRSWPSRWRRAGNQPFRTSSPKIRLSRRCCSGFSFSMDSTCSTVTAKPARLGPPLRWSQQARGDFRRSGREAATELNLKIPAPAIEDALDELLHSRQAPFGARADTARRGPVRFYVGGAGVQGYFGSSLPILLAPPRRRLNCLAAKISSRTSVAALAETHLKLT